KTCRWKLRGWRTCIAIWPTIPLPLQVSRHEPKEQVMSNIQEIVISTPLRTAIGTFGGMLRDIPASDLGATVAKRILEDAQLDPGQVDQVIVGNVLQAGQGMNPGRQVALKAGLP